MSAATGTAPSSALGPPVRQLLEADELELSCLVCHGEVSHTEKVAYWPPTPDRVGVIAHVRCLGERGSL
jgi:hypothetical protein